MPVHADSLQETLNAQIGIENTGEESQDILVYSADIQKEYMEQKLVEIQTEAENVEENAKKASEREKLIIKARPIVEATYVVSSPGSGLCARYVSQCYSIAGFGYSGGHARDMYWRYCNSSNRDDIISGMIIAVPSHTLTYLGGQYGHVGIIVTHDGQYYVRHNVGPIAEMTLDEWIAQYGSIYQPKWGFAW